MGVEKLVIRPGNGIDFPKKHDEVSMEYTGWLFDDDAPDHKGGQFDTSVGRGDLITPIGAGRVIKGWDEGILGSAEASPMTLGEKATLIITSSFEPCFFESPALLDVHAAATANLVQHECLQPIGIAASLHFDDLIRP
ncbi:hypothetical protein J4E85_004812 [Alternaria conjuncta]|uniref:uncharacterized protein n=1 Tax=Alternaria conjuncta TaxID=181017 RepID=UPI00221F7036|nr:uncharacterized protein J4E85_004812 [Alternaria conjuncta]KAI4930187.1 hypothetical protein J4E85_004812 [Alternaria conjuncta]